MNMEFYMYLISIFFTSYVSYYIGYRIGKWDAFDQVDKLFKKMYIDMRKIDEIRSQK